MLIMPDTKKRTEKKAAREAHPEWDGGSGVPVDAYGNTAGRSTVYRNGHAGVPVTTARSRLPPLSPHKMIVRLRCDKAPHWARDDWRRYADVNPHPRRQTSPHRMIVRFQCSTAPHWARDSRRMYADVERHWRLLRAGRRRG